MMMVVISDNDNIQFTLYSSLGPNDAYMRQ